MKTLHFTNAWHASSGGIRTFYRELLKAAEQHQRPTRMIVPSETTHVEPVHSYARIYHIAAPRSLLFDYHIANSHYTAQELQRAMTARHKRIVMVHPMGVNIDLFSPVRRSPEARRRLLTLVAGNERTRLLLYVGRLSAEKNLPLLLQTLQCLRHNEHRDFRLVLAGDGPLSNWLRQESLRVAPQRVHLLRQLHNQSALASLYANCDAFLHPNPREPFGIAPLEAMASALPLVAPNAGGVLSYANSENAWLAAPDGEAFANAVRDVFSDDEVKWYRVARARRTAESYAWDKVATEFFKLYDRLYGMALEETSTGRFSQARHSKAKLALLEKSS